MRGLHIYNGYIPVPLRPDRSLDPVLNIFTQLAYLLQVVEDHLQSAQFGRNFAVFLREDQYGFTKSMGSTQLADVTGSSRWVLYGALQRLARR
jgi:hypothetical protein